MLRAMPSSLLRQDTFLGCQSKLGWVPCLHHAMARRASVQQYLAERHTPVHSLLHSSPYDIHDGQCLFSQGKAWWFVDYLSLAQGLATILLWGMAPRTSAGPQQD